MKAAKEKRNDERWQHMAAISVSYFNKNAYFDGQTLNYGSGGLCFKSNSFLKPGITVFIRLKEFRPNDLCNGVSNELRSVTLAEVKWCRKIHDIDLQTYSVGVGYFPPAY